MPIILAYLEQRQRQTIVGIRVPTNPPGFYLCEDVCANSLIILHQHEIFDVPLMPPHLNERLFHCYAPRIGQALAAFPSYITIALSENEITPQTFARAFRDALRAKRAYAYKDPSIDESRWILYNTAIATEIRGQHVLIGNRAAIVASRPLEVPGAIGAAPTIQRITIAGTETNLRHLAQLITGKAFLPPLPDFIIEGSVPTLRDIIEKQYDVAFESMDNGKWRMM